MGGVIFRQDTAEAARRFKALGIDPADYVGEYGQRGLFLDLESGRIDCKTFCRLLAQAAGREQASHEVALDCWLGFVIDVPTDRLHALLRLHEKGYRLGLLSNTNPFIMEYMDSPRFGADGRPISDYFDSLHLSYRMGICKPSPEIFRRALYADGFSADETLFIDDSEANTAAAATLGIHTLHIPQNTPWIQPLASLLSLDFV